MVSAGAHVALLVIGLVAPLFSLADEADLQIVDVAFVSEEAFNAAFEPPPYRAPDPDPEPVLAAVAPPEPEPEVEAAPPPEPDPEPEVAPSSDAPYDVA
ncbi:MAG: hypothetical protein AAFR16_12550, partial [Pseudomonadota bacterium]